MPYSGQEKRCPGGGPGWLSSLWYVFPTFLFLLSACSQQPQTGRLSGCFLLPNEEDQEGIRVYLPGTPYQSATDRYGQFQISQIEPGEYEIVVREDGYEEYREPVQITAGEEVDLATRTLLPLPPDVGSVEGKILLTDREQHDGTIVLLLGTKHNTLTKADGSFRFEEVEPGQYTLVAFRDGYRNLTDVEVNLVEPADLSLPDMVLQPLQEPTQPPEEEDEKPAGNLSLWGTVLLEGETEHDGTLISVAENPDLSTTTAEQGQFRLDGLTEGSYTLDITHPGFLPEQVANVEPFSATGVVGLQVTLRRETPRIGRSVLQGLVTLRNQNNHEGSTVRLVGIQQTVITDYSGRYIFVDIPSGTYTIIASHPGYKTTRAVGVGVQPGAISQAPPIELPEITVEDLDEGVEGYGEIQGTVTLEDDPNAGGVSVGVQTAGLVVLSGPGGSFFIPGVPAGRHLVMFEKAGYETAYVPDVAVMPNLITTMQPVVLHKQVERPYVVSTEPPNGERKVGFDEFLDVLVKFSDRMDGESVKRSVFISPPVDARLFFGRESDLSNNDTLHIELGRQGRNPLQFKTTYEIVIAQSAADTKGVSLEDDYDFHFTTDGPLIVRTIPEAGERDIRFLPADRLIVETNAPVDPGSVARYLRIQPRPSSVPEVFASRRGAGGRIEIEVGFNPGQRYTISLGRGLRTPDGQLFSNTPYRFSFSLADMQGSFTAPPRVEQTRRGRYRSR